MSQDTTIPSTKSPQPSLGKQLSHRARARILVRRVAVRPILFVFDGIWHFMAFIFGAFIIGGSVVNVVWSLLTAGTAGVNDPQTWVAVRAIQSDPQDSLYPFVRLLLMIPLAYIGHRARHGIGQGPVLPDDLTEFYGVKLVRQINPSPRDLSLYNPFYIARRLKDSGGDADAAARTAIEQAKALSPPAR